MDELLDELPDADTNDIHDLLFEVKDYAKRIHWWVRLFGICWILSILIAVGFWVGVAS
jgi:hypothetical protein